MTEYWLQKKTIGGWSMVTYYVDADEAWRNYASCVGNGMSGYSWRLVRVETIKEDMLNDVVDIQSPDYDAILFGRSFSKDGVRVPAEKVLIQDAPKSTGWGADTSRWGKPASIDPSPAGVINPSTEHGLTGSVWLVHHGLRKKTRVSADKVDAMMKEGYVKGNPRTQFEL